MDSFFNHGYHQIGDNAGPGAWGTFATGVMSLAIVFLAFKNGEKDFKNSDHMSFSLAILCIVLYLTVENQTYSLVTVLLILFFAMYPTFRKSYYKPEEETLSLYVIAGIRSMLSVIATINISILTIGVPVFVILVNSVFIAMVVIRKRKL